MNHKALSSHLNKLALEDQKRLADLGKELKSAKSLKDSLYIIKPIAKKCQKTAEKMLFDLKKSNIDPTIPNIGDKASNAIILIALHSYIEVMIEVKTIFEELKSKYPIHDLPIRYLAVLVDRIEIIKTRRQLLGTTSYTDKDQEYYVPILELDKLNERREKYLLPPCNLKAIAQIQKPMSDKQYLLNFAYMDKKITQYD